VIQRGFKTQKKVVVAQIVDVRSSGGELIILGGALGLPTWDGTEYPVNAPVIGSIRYNSTTASLEIFSGLVQNGLPVWSPATGSGSGVTSFNARSGAITLTPTDITNTLGFTPLSNAVMIQYAQLPPSVATLPITYTQPGLQPVNQQVWTIPVTVPFGLLINSTIAGVTTFAPNSVAYAGTVATALASFALGYVRNAAMVPIGTIEFPAGGGTPLFISSQTADPTWAYLSMPNDVLVMSSPMTQDLTLADVGIVLLGTRTA
jgi:hypothetical protein